MQDFCTAAKIFAQKIAKCTQSSTNRQSSLNRRFPPRLSPAFLMSAKADALRKTTET
jgi:hypothetical protein